MTRLAPRAARKSRCAACIDSEDNENETPLYQNGPFFSSLLELRAYFADHRGRIVREQHV
jgi:hypothetical protein